jgi:dolichyl-phosphate beta-glucosyltransferase
MTKKYVDDGRAGIVVRGVKQINLGKGGAVKRGMMYSRGEYVLFLDADGATHYEEIEAAYNSCKQITKLSGNDLGCAIGSRNIGQKEIRRNPIRKFLNWGMTTLVQTVLGN